MSQDKEREALIEQARKHVKVWDSPTPVHHTVWANDAADLLRQLVDVLATQPPAVAQVPQWMKPHPKCDEACIFQCTEGFTKFPQCAAAPEAPAQRCPYCDDTGDVHTPTGEWRGRCTCPAGTEAPAQAAQSAGEVERGDVVAFEFYNRATGHAIVDYSVNTHVGYLTADKGYEARPLVYADKREEVTDGSKPIPLWQAREALDELEAAARGDAPFNHQAAAVVRAALSHKEQT